MRKNHITAFYVETLLLILVFITIILVLTHVFGLGRAQSAAARELNDARMRRKRWPLPTARRRCWRC